MSALSYILRMTYWLKDYFHGSPIYSHYEDIQSIMENFEYGEKRRAHLLEELLKYAVSNCKFYSKHDFKQLHSFPVTNKSILFKNYKDIIVNISNIPLQSENLHIQKTSGSTGIPFAIPQNTIKRNRRIAELKYFGEKVGFKSHEKLVHLRTWNKWQRKSKLKAFKENIIPFDISKINDLSLRELCNIINKRKVVAIRGYASSLDLLTRYAIDHHIKFPNLRIMIAGSEALQEGVRYSVKDILGCNIISQYANEENGILAQEQVLSEGISPFYLNQASYFFEVLRMEEDKPADFGELGRIVITDLFNYAFPVIRYDTGDTGILYSKDRYSNSYPVLGKLFGRRIDLVTDTSNEIVHPISFSRILKNYPEITQWQFIQNGERDYELKLITKYPNFNIGEIKKEFIVLFGKNARFSFKFVNEIPVVASGKRKPVVNNWKR